MPINPAIALGVRPPEISDPMEAQARAVTLRQLAQQNRLLDMEMAERERAIERKNQIRQLYRMGLNPEQLRKEVAVVDPQAALEMDTAEISRRKARAEAEKAEREAQAAVKADIAKHAWALYNTPREQRAAVWGPIRGELLRTGRYSADQLGQEPPDDNTLRVLGLMTLDPDKQTKILNDIEAEKRARAADQRAAEEHSWKTQRQPFEQAAIEADASIKKITAGQVREHGMPMADKLRLDRMSLPNTPTELAVVATDPRRSPEERRSAEDALKRLNLFARESRPVVNVHGGGGGTDPAKDVAEGIAAGTIPPSYINPRTEMGMRVLAHLKRSDYDLTTATRDWEATKRRLASMNSTQQLRLAQAVDLAHHQVGIIRGLFEEWEKSGYATKVPVLNAQTLRIAKNMGGRAGEIAAALEAQIADLTSELGTVYKGGNSSTDHSLKLAAENLQANWNSRQFQRQLENIEKILTIRRNSMKTFDAEAGGITPDSPYVPKQRDSATPGANLPQGGGKVIDEATVNKFLDATGNDWQKATAMILQHGWKLPD